MGGITQEKLLYLNVSKGRMTHKKDGVITHDFGGYCGTFLGIRERQTEFEGKPQTRIDLKMKDTDSDEIALIQFNKKSWAAFGLMASIRKINLSQPFTVKVWGSEDNEKISFVGLQQEGYKYEGNRKTIEPDKSFPRPEPITINGEKQFDWTKTWATMEEVIKHINETHKVAAPVSAVTETPVDGLIAGGTDADLPF